MIRRHLTALGLAAGLTLGFLISWAPSVYAGRNSAGTMDITGSDFVTGTTITSTAMNAKLADVETELTSSLDRSGRGPMLAPLECTNGTVSLPSITFDSDTDTGLYRIGANNPGMAVGGTLVQSWSSTTAASFSGQGAGNGILASGGNTSGTGAQGQGGAPNGAGVVGTGDGTGNGGTFAGGDSSGTGAATTGGAPNGMGLLSVGDGTAAGVSSTGGDSSGLGGLFTGGAPNGTGAKVVGTGTGKALEVGEGYAWFSGTNPPSTNAYANTVTPTNIVKAWARFTTDGLGGLTVVDAFNITSCAIDVHGGDDGVVCNIAADMADDHYAAISGLSRGPTGIFTSMAPLLATTSSVSFYMFNLATGATTDTSSGVLAGQFFILGAQ